jgi:hypothetical protein
MQEAWKSSKKQCFYRNQGALVLKELLVFHILKSLPTIWDANGYSVGQEVMCVCASRWFAKSWCVALRQ